MVIRLISSSGVAREHCPVCLDSSSGGKLCHAAGRTPNPLSRKRMDMGILVALYIDLNQNPFTDCSAWADIAQESKHTKFPPFMEGTMGRETVNKTSKINIYYVRW